MDRVKTFVEKRLVLIIAMFVACSIIIGNGMNAEAADDWSAIFDANYYAQNNQDVVAKYGNNPQVLFQHFVTIGVVEGRQGCEEFNVQAYMSRYPDLQAIYGDNLKLYYVHYLKVGKAEGRNGRAGSVTITNNQNESSITLAGVEHVLAQYSANGVALYCPKTTREGSSYTYSICPYAAALIDAAGITPGMGQKEMADKLAEYLSSYATYDYSYNSSRSFIAQHTGVCHNYSVTFNALCRMVGLDSHYIVNWGDNHAWNVVTIGGVDYYYDVTWISCYKEYSRRDGYNYSYSQWNGVTADVFYRDGDHTPTGYDDQDYYDYDHSYDDCIDRTRNGNTICDVRNNL